jgi:ornithine cyclodeaminase
MMAYILCSMSPFEQHPPRRPDSAPDPAAPRRDPIVVLTEQELRQLVKVDLEALAAIEAAFTNLAEGRADVPPIVGLFVPERHGEVDVKGAYIHGGPGVVVKIASGFFDNARWGLPSGSGLMVVLSADTGYPQAVLLDNGYLTDVRTALAGAAAARALAPAQVHTAGVIGAGTQGRFQARALRLVRPFRRLLVYDRSPAAVDAYVREMTEELSIEVAAADAESLVRASDAVITCTPSHSPVLRASWLHAGLHVTAMGADTPEKQELESAVLARATRLACDLKVQCFARGEYRHALADGVLGRDADVAELGDLTSGRRGGRERADEITVCALTGVGVQDAAIALLAFERARAAGVGRAFPPEAGGLS